MTSFSEQLSVRTTQWEAQLDLFRQLSDRALESTEQLVALNMRTSRASVEQAAGTLKQFLEASDPRDLFAVSSAAQGQVHQLFAYGRELLGIASGLRTTWSALPVLPAPLRLLPSPNMNIPRSPAQVAEQAAIATAGAVTISSEIGAAATDAGSAIAEATLEQAKAAQPSATQAQPTAAQAQPPAAAQASIGQVEAKFEASVETAIADEVPPATPTPLARALNEAAPKPASVEHPIVSTVPLEAAQAFDAVELPMVAPVEHTAPVQQAQGPEARRPRPTRRK